MKTFSITNLAGIVVGGRLHEIKGPAEIVFREDGTTLYSGPVRRTGRAPDMVWGGTGLIASRGQEIPYAPSLESLVGVAKLSKVRIPLLGDRGWSFWVAETKELTRSQSTG
jgi:hypothetical protein